MPISGSGFFQPTDHRFPAKHPAPGNQHPASPSIQKCHEPLTFGKTVKPALGKLAGALLATSAAVLTPSAVHAEQQPSNPKAAEIVPQPKAEDTIWQKVRNAVKQGIDPFTVTTQAERNKIACQDDGAPTPEPPTTASAASLAKYMTQRAVLIGDNPSAVVLPPDAPPAPLNYRTGNFIGSGWTCISTPEKTEVGTNRHVVEDALKDGGTITVTMPDKQTYEAEVVGSDPKRDFAYLRLKDTKGLVYPTVHFTPDTNTIQKGDYVATMGNPQRFKESFSDGRVSFSNRPGDIVPNVAVPLLQITAPFTLGSSGGQAANLKGEMVGTNTAIRPGNGDIGFAVSANASADGLLAIRLNEEFGLPNQPLQLGLTYNLDTNDAMRAELAYAEKSLPTVRNALQYIERELKQLNSKRAPKSIPPQYRAALEKETPNLSTKPLHSQLKLYKERLESEKEQHQDFLNKFEPRLERDRAALQTLEQNRAPGTTDGLVVDEVVKGGLAEQSGIPAGAVLTHVNGQPITAANAPLLITSRFNWQPTEIRYDFQGKSQTVIANPDGIRNALSAKKDSAKP
ncbi:MAG TPA: trypsin-like peptidase domain-containing protein [Coleofasciculaceae cyanobacterium]